MIIIITISIRCKSLSCFSFFVFHLNMIKCTRFGLFLFYKSYSIYYYYLLLIIYILYYNNYCCIDFFVNITTKSLCHCSIRYFGCY